jgi:acetate kinase
MTRRASEILRKTLSEMKLVSLMLGSGTTANATAYGRSHDISTGFTPTEGLLQSTRCGDIDPLAITYLMRKLSLGSTEMERILNHESGWLGISGLSSDFSVIEQAADRGHEQAQIALDVFVHRAKKYVGAYAAVLGGIDALLFSGGIGEKSPTARMRICEGLEFLGLHLDSELNENLQGEGIVSTSSSPAAIIVVSTDEEKVIAKETYGICCP